ncbi:hypothetical protein ERJ75_001115700 [Trypanosoma vivax]|nr:hypothetical protein ERJ75_001115700 [Trypanosoma vivax]
MGDARAAQETLNVLKGEVQDATANNILTAYEMAKSNTSLSRLQELIDAKGERGQGRKAFKFSASSKVRCATVADTSVGVTAAQVQEEVLGCRDNVFGDARKKDRFLSPSKALFFAQLQGVWGFCASSGWLRLYFGLCTVHHLCALPTAAIEELH